ncbi:MAG: hypothetical protein KHY08_10030 [Lachnospiraceae bacterium]|nr:hypothetical protein [Lachnospiraceae bacterium]
MYEIIKNVIQSGRYELTDILTKIDTLWVQSSLTDNERTELMNLARSGADPAQGVDVLAKLSDLDKRVAKLERAGATDPEPGEEYPEYVAGKWYYKDDKITCNGNKYICTAPEGVVCVWSPDEYPAYWQLVE